MAARMPAVPRARDGSTSGALLALPAHRRLSPALRVQEASAFTMKALYGSYPQPYESKASDATYPGCAISAGRRAHASSGSTLQTPQHRLPSTGSPHRAAGSDLLLLTTCFRRRCAMGTTWRQDQAQTTSTSSYTASKEWSPHVAQVAAHTQPHPTPPPPHSSTSHTTTSPQPAYPQTLSTQYTHIMTQGTTHSSGTPYRSRA